MLFVYYYYRCNAGCVIAGSFYKIAIPHDKGLPYIDNNAIQLITQKERI